MRFEDYLMEQFMKSEDWNGLDDCIDEFDDWVNDLDTELFIAYAEQYRNMAVADTIDKLGGM